MITTSPGVVLYRRAFRETDKLAVVYTRDVGKVTLRFVGVQKPRAKLKAFCETLILADYRIYLKPASEFGKCLGGEIITCFPCIRRDYLKTVTALNFLELFLRLTPERQPNPGKYELLKNGLEALEGPYSPWVRVAFILRLLHLAGFSLFDRGCPGRNGKAFWQLLHESDLSDLPAASSGWGHLEDIQGYVMNHVEQQLDRPLRTDRFI